ncbi:ubiquinone biosynthesis accessory factor UbiJ [Azomonas macrocytogenes]|uniref:Ubiquinone biosynthesis accessory factor UbiJ n=1 Tax=Azomonas macrocytogenes TaxID=69962 RepID=A0A839T1P4_AZOMA|nr:SCP2 sterol-binding domain-containing protein [Azomonas macrocytogenes]MBB3102889.1 ubiquinone biosynthesis protein UbiJ [Azomonas macrocytogenes]
MLYTALLATAEQGVNAALRMDPAALPHLATISGLIVEIECTTPPWKLFVQVGDTGLRLAAHWEAEADVHLRTSARSLLHLALTRDKLAVLQGREVTLQGNRQALFELAAVLQNLELDWEYELSRWLGPLGGQLLGSSFKGQREWIGQSIASLYQMLADYLNEETRALVGQAEAQARFAELDDMNATLSRLEARIERLAQNPTPRAPE